MLKLQIQIFCFQKDLGFFYPMIKSHAFQPEWKGKEWNFSKKLSYGQDRKRCHVYMHLYTRWQSSVYSSYSLHRQRVFVHAKNELKKLIIQHFLITWHCKLYFPSRIYIKLELMFSGATNTKKESTESLLLHHQLWFKQDTYSTLFALGAVDTHTCKSVLLKTQFCWFTGRISGVKHMCAPWQSTLFCSKPCWGNV